jgi:putative acetyltransferase
VKAMVIRAEAAQDADSVRHLLRAAFAGEAKATLVDELRADGDILLSLVALDQTARVVGYVAFPRLSVAGNPCAGLAPVAVAPEYQQRGIGRTLIEQGMSVLKQRGEKLVFVLGEPAYYARFGFDGKMAAAFTSDYSGPYFMACRAEGAPTSGAVRYPSAFARLG